jgi:hypothetical protein
MSHGISLLYILSTLRVHSARAKCVDHGTEVYRAYNSDIGTKICAARDFHSDFREVPPTGAGKRKDGYRAELSAFAKESLRSSRTASEA